MTKKYPINNPLIISNSESNSEIINKETPKSRGISSSAKKAFSKLRTLVLTGVAIATTGDILSQQTAAPVGVVNYMEVDVYHSIGAQTYSNAYKKDNIHSGVATTIQALHADSRNNEMITANMHNAPLNTTNNEINDLNNFVTYKNSIGAPSNNIPFVSYMTWNYSEETGNAATFGYTGYNDPRIWAHAFGHYMGNFGHDSHVNFADYYVDDSANGNPSLLYPANPSIMSINSGNVNLFSTDSNHVATNNDEFYHFINNTGYHSWIAPLELDNRQPGEISSDLNTNSQNRIWMDNNSSFVKQQAVGPLPAVQSEVNGNQIGIDSLSRYNLNNIVFYTVHDTSGAIDSAYFVKHNILAYLYDSAGNIIDGPQHIDSTFTVSNEGSYKIAAYDRTSNQLSDTSSTAAMANVDLTAPTSTASTISYNPTNDGTIEVTYNFNEPVTGLDNFNTDFNVSGPANITDLVQISPTEYVVTLNPTGNGNINLTLLGGACTDIAGNPNIANNGFNIEYDGIAPTASMSSSESYHTNQSPIPLTINLSESPQVNLNPANFLQTNCTIEAGSFQVSSDGKTYTLNINPISEGPLSISLPNNSFQDAAGNFNGTGTVQNFDYDTTVPQIDLNSDTTIYNLGQNGTATLSPDEIATITDNNPSGTIDTGNPESVDCDDLGYGQGTISATDASGNNSTINYLYNVVDTIKPINTTPTNITIDLNGKSSVSISNEQITGNDNCEIDPNSKTWSISEFTTPGEYQVTSTVSDMSGNTKSKESTITVDNTVGINDIENLAGFNIYPNPTNGNINLILEGQKIKSVKIISPLGKTISHNPEVNNSSILMDISYFAPGIYLVQIETENGEIGMKKIIKN